MLFDLRFACRQLRKSPGFTLVALLTLALGLGVNTSMFTVANTVLLQQLPYREPDQLVRVFRTAPQSQSWPHSAGSFHDLRTQAHTFAGLAAYRGGSFNYAAPGQPAERLRGMSVSTDFFPLLGSNAALGRTFLPEETRPGGPEVAVISHECWQSRFASDASIIGRQVRIDSNLVTIVGVMPASFVPRLLWGPVEVWRPLPFTAAEEQSRDNNYLGMIGRIAPGFTFEQAEIDLRTIAARIAAEHPETNAGGSVRLVPLSRSGQDDATRHASWFLLGLAGFVLLIACVNLANLQFSRAAARAREQAIRIALGGSRWRIIRTLFAESILLGVGGGALGLLLATWCNDFLGRQLVMGPAAGVSLPLDQRVFGFSLLLAALCAGASGLLPAWFATRNSVNDTLKLGGRGVVGRSHHRLRHGLVIAEVALALVLLAGASLFIRGLQRFTEKDPGWNPDNLLTAVISLPTTRYPDEPARRAFYVKLDQALAASPLVEHAALVSAVPIREYSSSTNYVVEGRPALRPGEEPLANLAFVTPGFLDTMGLRLRQGRFFTAEDRAEKPRVIVINETMARLLFPGENPVGRRIGEPDSEKPTWWEIIGVVSDAGFPADLNPPGTHMQSYRAVAQDSFSFTNIALRGRVPVDQLTAELRRIVTAIDPDQPVYNVISARADIERTLANFNLIGRLLGGFALLGLLLAAIGLYGVLANYVQQRTPELGVRLALGAQLGDILRLVLGQGFRLALLGVVIGLAGALVLGRTLTRLLPALGSLEPLTLSAVVAGLLGVAFLACWLPARRATKVDPMVALRTE
jgi:putative ABC transport system permease protein